MSRSSQLFVAFGAWLLSRLLLVLFAQSSHAHWGDVNYYFHGLRSEELGQRALEEYPDATVIPLRIIDALTTDIGSFTWGVIIFALLLDAVISTWLARNGHWRGLAFWLITGLLLGPLMVSRMDLLPGMLVAGAAVWITRNSRMAAVFLGIATSAKLWPLALATGLVGHWRYRGTWVRLGHWALTIIAIAVFTVFTSGWWRVLSPLQYQTDRGLQSEALLATPFIWLAYLSDHWDISLAPSKSFEVLGPGVDTVVSLSTALSLGVALFGAAVTARRFLRAGRLSPRATRAYWLALILLIVVTSKVFSPQYLLWFLPLLAVMIAVDAADSRELRLIAWLMIPTATLTTAFFPFLFGGFIAPDPSLISVVCLSIRNILMLVIVVLACRWAWITLRAEHAAVAQPPAQPVAPVPPEPAEPTGVALPQRS